MTARRAPVLRVVLLSQAVGLTLVLVVVAIVGDPVPSIGALAKAAGAGLGGVVALAAFYRALAIGTMSIVAPISATGAAVPVIVGLARGERPGTLALAAMAAAGLGVVLASREQHAEADRAAAGRLSVGLALVAALGFGTFFVLINSAAEESPVWSLLPGRLVSVAVLALVAVLARTAIAPPAAQWPPLAGAGALDAGANLLFVLASTRGLLSTASVLASLYPLTTVILARVFLGERIRRVQELGVALALAGVALIAAS
jgi:drug/metabolite transporter (DMT)-like permease